MTTTDTPPSEPADEPQTMTEAIDLIVDALMAAVHPELERRVRAAVTAMTHISGNNFMETALAVNKAMLEQINRRASEQHQDMQKVFIRLDTLDVQQQVLVEALRDGELHRLFADDDPAASPEAREAGV